MNNKIGKAEIETQKRVLDLFQNELNYQYLGDWTEVLRTQSIEEDLLIKSLVERKYEESVAKKACDELVKVATSIPNGLYEANKEVYKLLRYGVTVRVEQGKPKETIWLIDWENPENNHFAVAEEVSFKGGQHDKRPDIVIYVNGIALGVIELKRSKVSVSEGIRQNLDNQKSMFIQKFFTTIQFTFAGSDAQGLRYGTIETTEKYYLQWKEESNKQFDYSLDKHLYLLGQKERFLELIHDFVVFDKGVKKLCRPNQYFGITAAHENVKKKQGGIIWHTQGSGKSLTMVWLTKWILENVEDSRVLIITDREELDDQIQKLFIGVEESIYRTKSGRDLISVLNEKNHSLICSLVHKFGRNSEYGDYESFIEDLKESLGSDFKAKGDIYVFVDECHRTQSGSLHDAMKMILPESLFIGFTGTPLLKKISKRVSKSLDHILGIHTSLMKL